MPNASSIASMKSSSRTLVELPILTILKGATGDKLSHSAISSGVSGRCGTASIRSRIPRTRSSVATPAHHRHRLSAWPAWPPYANRAAYSSARFRGHPRNDVRGPAPNSTPLWQCDKGGRGAGVSRGRSRFCPLAPLPSRPNRYPAARSGGRCRGG